MNNNSLGIGRPSTVTGSGSGNGIGTNQSRKTSAAVYNMFDAKQVQTFKEAFSMIDQDSDGWITEADLKTMLTSLGQAPTPKLLTSLLTARPRTFTKTKTKTEQQEPEERLDNNSQEYKQGMNFTTFLTIMSEKLLELDSEIELLNAFECFDDLDSGLINAKELSSWLATAGDKMSKDEIDKLLSPPYCDRHGTSFNYRDFISALRVSEAEPVNMKE